MNKRQKIIVVVFIVWSLFLLQDFSSRDELAGFHTYPDSLQSTQRAMLSTLTKLVLGGATAGALYFYFSEKHPQKGEGA